MVITGNNVSDISDLQIYLHQHFDIKSLGKLHYFLCLEISNIVDGIYLSQAKYASDLISHAGLTDSKTASTPLEADCRLTPLNGTLLKTPRSIGTILHDLHFSVDLSLVLTSYSDADWAGDPTNRRSITGYCFFLGVSLVSWRSKKQTIVSRSSAESEYRALANSTSELL
ncbi:uncharacterized mitochondrial protein AtMg00810-like [Impatiens glandulifera]|uniref:uncharacterized mitochondrial protein AtMg00810-like n=1 Tax=Impatiens glandulifera TaxID=253017 RepID=UPI001FB1535C|nr:uncharacterized mitochondrial protein AtMg00810-like [Impatiens glandulifera]